MKFAIVEPGDIVMIKTTVCANELVVCTHCGKNITDGETVYHRKDGPLIEACVFFCSPQCIEEIDWEAVRLAIAQDRLCYSGRIMSHEERRQRNEQHNLAPITPNEK